MATGGRRQLGAVRGAGVGRQQAGQRRAERRLVGLEEAGLIDNRELLVFVNRLSDLVFLMARAADRGAEVPE